MSTGYRDSMMTDLLKRGVIRDRWLAYQAAAIAASVLLTLTSVRPIEIGAAVAATGLLEQRQIFKSKMSRERTRRTFQTLLGASWAGESLKGYEHR
jgi:hypothetical protein